MSEQPRWFVQRPHPTEYGQIQVCGPLSREDAEQQMAAWRANRPDLVVYSWDLPETLAQPEPPESSVRALLAQWRRLQALYEDEMRQYRVGLVERREQDDGPFYGDGRAITYKACIEQLEQALKPLADLAAELQRFAEGFDPETDAPERAQALAWAARLKAVTK